MSTSSEDLQQPIVVGVDGSPSGGQALSWALRQARRTGAPVRAVTVWHQPGLNPYSPVPTPIVTPLPDLESEAADTLSKAVAAAGDEPGARVEQRVLEGHPAAVLLDQAAAAGLLVVGSRGHGAFTGMLLGSVSSHCVSHAPCPVVVVPAAAADR